MSDMKVFEAPESIRISIPLWTVVLATLAERLYAPGMPRCITDLLVGLTAPFAPPPDHLVTQDPH